MAILESDSLLIAMWILSMAIIFFNTLVLALGLPSRRETGVTKLMIYLTMGSNYFTAVFLLIVLSMESSRGDFNEVDQKRFQLLCNLAGYLGITSMQISLWSMLIAALTLLLGLLFPRKFKRGKNYVILVRTIIFAELMVLLPGCCIPFLPISQFYVSQRNSWDSVCLPIHSAHESLWVYTAFWFLVSTTAVATLLVTFALLICYLKRQKQESAHAIPMQARLIQKKTSQVKRMSCLMMSYTLCWIPALSVCVVIFAGHSVSPGIVQWVVGFVLPLGAAVGPLWYIINTGLSGSTMENCIDLCCTKAEKQSNAFRVHMGQLNASRRSRSCSSSNKQDSNNPSGSAGPTHSRRVASSIRQSGHQRSISKFSGISGRSKSAHSSRAKNAPRGATWVQSVPLSGRNMKEQFGVAEWQAANGSPRKGLLKLFSKGHFQQWKVESTILAKLNTLERHPNIVDYLWHSKSSHTRLDRGHHEHMHLRRRTTVERYICTSYYHHGTLRDFLINYCVKLEEGYIHAIASQVCAGMVYLHSNSIIHNFLESTNILIGGNPENMTLKAVIANFTHSYDLTQDKEPSHVPASPTSPSAKPEEISTNWVDKLSNSVARSTVHNKVLEGITEDQMCATDIRSFAVIMVEMLTWLKQLGMVRKGTTQAVRGYQCERIDAPQVMDQAVHVTEEQSPFVRNLDASPRKPISRRHQVLRGEQKQHINVVCEPLPDEAMEYYACNTFPRRKMMKQDPNDAPEMQKHQAHSKSAFLKIMHQKQDSLCSTDSGVSSQPSSKANSVHSSSSAGSSDSRKSPRLPNNKRNGKHPGSDVEFDATTEMWVESHVDESGGFRPCIMEHGLRRTPVPKTLLEEDMCQVNASYEISDNSTEDPEDPNAVEDGMLPRSSSSLSQFYVRKRAPRPQSLSFTSSTTLPHKANAQDMELYNARANVNATLQSRPQSCFVSSEKLDNQHIISNSIQLQQRSVTPMPGYPGSAMPVTAFPKYLPGLITSIPPNQRSVTPPMPEREQQFATIRRSRSRKRTSSITVCPPPQQINITSNPKHLNSRPAGQCHSNVHDGNQTISQQKKPHWDCSCPSGIGEQQLGYCQELQTLFPHMLCSDGRVVEHEVECGRAMTQWMASLQRMEGYLPKQLVDIIEVCWIQEPSPPSTDIYRMLDNCLTEVAL